MKVSYTPEQVHALFESQSRPYWIAGGWAIDYFLGRVTREHEDVDVAILRSDEQAFRAHLKDWELWPGLGNDQLEDQPISIEQPLPAHREVLWCRPTAHTSWAFELLLNKTKGDEWVFKRDDRIRKPVSELGSVTDSGIPYLNPEVVLLFKAKNNRDKDQHDFTSARPHLSTTATSWLKESLQMVHPEHAWLNEL
jgi:hypothetical protein